MLIAVRGVGARLGGPQRAELRVTIGMRPDLEREHVGHLLGHAFGIGGSKLVPPRTVPIAKVVLRR